MMPGRDLTASERDELIGAAIARYRAGELGPVSFVAELRRLRVPIADAEALKRTWRDECARNRNTATARA
jgi:hypothetical protein